jgi:hypothetical protein
MTSTRTDLILTGKLDVREWQAGGKPNWRETVPRNCLQLHDAIVQPRLHRPARRHLRRHLGVAGDRSALPAHWMLENRWSWHLRCLPVVAQTPSCRRSHDIDLHLPLRARDRAHYTYSEVPHDKWAEALIGITITEPFGFSRNHFDR